jgi:hypothetical protein
LLLHDQKEITEHSQKVGRLYGKVRKGCTAGRLTAHGIDNILDNLHNKNMGIRSFLNSQVILCSAQPRKYKMAIIKPNPSTF